MAIVVGTDEAGYGPNLGPLLISATIWRVPEQDCDLFELLAPAVSCAARDKAPLTIADSKELYKPHGSLERLEQGLLSALAHLNMLPLDWKQAWETLAPDSSERISRQPWHVDYSSALPVDADEADIASRAQCLTDALDAAQVELLGVRCRAVFPEEFNELVDTHGSKGELLSIATLKLIAEQLESIDDEPILIQCDKHGGRNRYSPLLQQQFPEYLVEIVDEGRAQSVYRWGPASRRTEIRFTAKGERFLPSALASMACKYLRELAMQSFNQYWSARVDGLKPTAGYPVDAKRFREDIQDAQNELGIDDRILWRCR